MVRREGTGKCVAEHETRGGCALSEEHACVGCPCGCLCAKVCPLCFPMDRACRLWFASLSACMRTHAWGSVVSRCVCVWVKGVELTLFVRQAPGKEYGMWGQWREGAERESFDSLCVRV